MNQREQAKLNEVRDLLIVIAERQRAIREEDLAGINNHLKALNSSVLKNTIRGVENEKSIKGTRDSMGLLKWAISGELLLLIAIIGLIVWLV